LNWSEIYPKSLMPSRGQINDYIGNPVWNELCGQIEQQFGVEPKVEYSTCSAAPGWNVKYRKGGRALCALYPRDGFFYCLIAIGPTIAQETELLLPTFSSEVRQMYLGAAPMNGTRWLMIDVRTENTARDVQSLVTIRAKAKR
jgi:hypothetical protein